MITKELIMSYSKVVEKNDGWYELQFMWQKVLCFRPNESCNTNDKSKYCEQMSELILKYLKK